MKGKVGRSDAEPEIFGRNDPDNDDKTYRLVLEQQIPIFASLVKNGCDAPHAPVSRSAGLRAFSCLHVKILQRNLTNLKY